MRISTIRSLVFVGLLFTIIWQAEGHQSHYDHHALKEWHTRTGHVHGSFYLYRDGKVYLEDEQQHVRVFKLEDFSKADQAQLKQQIQAIQALNQQIAEFLVYDKHPAPKREGRFLFILGLVLLVGLIWFALANRFVRLRRFTIPVALALAACTFLGMSDPQAIRSAFLAFSPQVNTRWDSTYFYVESKGIPETHQMMAGISDHGWQQQVPVPQCYMYDNAWKIPLNPVLSANPIPVDSVHFTRGAIAIAVNGVPIFNPHTNTGVDAFTDGQLDSFGGHSGRGDDYHYHTAPLHLYAHTTSNLPVAYAFDGYAVYGSLEPDGQPMSALDANHGHMYNGSYHYHGTSTSPYMIGRMAGEVTEDSTHQLIPQAVAHPVRNENWTPLKGALITACIPNDTDNGYRLNYTLNGGNGYATEYFWNGTQYTFRYITPSGTNSKTYNGFQQCVLTTGIGQLNRKEYNVSIYPNPFARSIMIHGLPTETSCQLFNQQGQLMFNGTHIERQDFSHLKNGVYILKIPGYTPGVFKLIKTF